MSKTYRSISKDLTRDHSNPAYVKALRSRVEEVQERENRKREKESLKSWMFANFN